MNTHSLPSRGSTESAVRTAPADLGDFLFDPVLLAAGGRERGRLLAARHFRRRLRVRRGRKRKEWLPARAARHAAPTDQRGQCTGTAPAAHRATSPAAGDSRQVNRPGPGTAGPAAASSISPSANAAPTPGCSRAAPAGHSPTASSGRVRTRVSCGFALPDRPIWSLTDRQSPAACLP